MASSSEDRTIRLWDVQTHHCLRVLRRHESGIRAIAFDPSGQLLASGSDNQTIRRTLRRLARVENPLRIIK